MGSRQMVNGLPPSPRLIWISEQRGWTLKVAVAGVWSVLPTESVARTETVCGPSARLAVV